MGMGMGSLRRAALSSVQGSPWPIGRRAGTPFPTTCSAWHRARLPGGCLVHAVFHYEKQEEAICPLAPVSFSEVPHTPLHGQYSLNTSAPSIHLGYQDTCEALRKVSDCIGQGSVMVSSIVSHSQGTSS